MALNNPNPALRKLFNSNIEDEKDELHFHKLLQDNSYLKNDFCIYKTDVVKSV